MANRPPSDKLGPDWDIDFAAALKKLRDEGEVNSPRATMLRIAWLRNSLPGASVTTESVKIEPDLVVIRALAGKSVGEGKSVWRV